MENETNPTQRIRRTPEQIKELLTEYRQSGKSEEEFATDKGIVLSTLVTWRRRYQRGSKPSPRWVEVGNAAAGLSSGPMAQIRLAKGLSVELNAGFQVEPIAALIMRLQKDD